MNLYVAFCRGTWYITDMNRNYQKELDRIIQKLGKKRPRLLLHGCCGPCSSSVLEYLTEYFDVTMLWYNPNIYPQEEFDRRFKALVKLVEDMGLADRVSILAEPWKSQDYYSRVRGLEQEPEGGKRCTECFRLRLMETAKLARHYGYDYFCSTLSLSRHKDALRINSLGEELGRAAGCPRTSKSAAGRTAPWSCARSTGCTASSTAAASSPCTAARRWRRKRLRRRKWQRKPKRPRRRRRPRGRKSPEISDCFRDMTRG